MESQDNLKRRIALYNSTRTALEYALSCLKTIAEIERSEDAKDMAKNVQRILSCDDGEAGLVKLIEILSNQVR